MSEVLRLWRSPAANASFRVARAVKYTALCVAALVSLFYPSTVVAGAFTTLPSVAYIWSAVLFVGAACCLVGVLTKTWVGEYIGSWGVMATLLLYSAGCFTDTVSFTGQRAFLGLILFAFAFSMLARRQDVVFQKRVADYEARVRAGRPGL